MTYSSRDRILKRLGFNSYREYLASTLWKTISKAVLARDYCKCRTKGCTRNFPRQVHHTSYTLRNLLGIETGSLVTLCSLCHEEVEFRVITRGRRKGQRVKLPPREVRSRTIKKVGRFRKGVELFVLRRILLGVVSTGEPYLGPLLKELRKLSARDRLYLGVP